MQNTIIAQIPVAGATQAVEAVIYRIKPDAMAGIGALRTQLLERVSRMTGFRSAVFMSGVLENDLAMDYVVWESLEDALRAATELEQDPIYKPLMASVQEIVLLDHLQSLERVAGSAEPGNVFEVAVSTLRDGEFEAFSEKVPALAERVTEQPGFVAWERARSVETPDRLLDVLQWETLEQAQQAAEVVHQTKECQVVFAHLAEDGLFAYFEVVETR